MLFTPTFSKAQIFFSMLTLTFSFVGFLFFFSADKLNSLVIEYGEQCQPKERNCIIEFTPQTDLVRPKLYYELDKFYSNYRSLVSS